MTRLAHLVLLSLAALAALAVAGCGNKEEFVTRAGTEGIYISVDDLTYQIQISRILNKDDVEDRGFLLGLPEGEELTADECWFAVFMRVENETDQELTAADRFKISDTQGIEFEPVEIDAHANLFAYDPRPIPPGELLPQLGSAASDNSIRGGLLLFKMKVQSLYNRPLEFEIESNRGGDNGIIDLDV
jgi:hypothetical protein